MCDRRIVDAGGVKTRYVAAGDGRAVVLLHGAGPGVDGASTWQHTIPALARVGRVVVPDLVGFGATERPAGLTYSMPVWVAHLGAFLDALELGSATFVGTSFGAALALRFTLAHPERVDGLVAAGCPGLSFPLSTPLDELWGFEPGRENMRRVLTGLTFRPDTMTDEAIDARHRASLEPGVTEAFASMFPPPRQRWLDAMACSAEQVSGIDRPTLIIHGRDDPVVPVDVAWRLHHLLAASQLHTFGRCGHLPPIERPDEFNALVANFTSS